VGIGWRELLGWTNDTRRRTDALSHLAGCPATEKTSTFCQQSRSSNDHGASSMVKARTAPAPAAAIRDCSGVIPVAVGRFRAPSSLTATFYLVRNNFAPVSKEIGAARSFDKVMIGNILPARPSPMNRQLVNGLTLADRSDAAQNIWPWSIVDGVL